MNVLISQQSFSQIDLTSNYPALPHTVVRESTENKARVSINYKNNGPQRHREALITTPNGKGSDHNYFKMQANGKRIYDYSMEGAPTCTHTVQARTEMF